MMAGQPFLEGILPADARLAVEHAFGADLTADPGTWTWTDTTADVMYAGGGVAISPMGRGDETAKSQPAGSKYQLLNTSGNYSKDFPASPYWPNVRANTPVRVSVQSTLSPTFRSAATTTGTGSSFAATAPAGVAAGDVVVAFHTADAAYATEMGTPTGAPWRLLEEIETVDTVAGLARLSTRVWYYRASGAAPGSYTFTQGTASDGVVTIAAIQNAALFSIKATSSSEITPGASFDTPSSSPLRADDFELRWAAGSDLAGVAGVTWTPPAGLTERSDAQSGTFTTATLATRTTGATTATGVKTFTASSSALDWAHGVTVNFANMNVRKQGYSNGFVPEWDDSANLAVVKGSASGSLRRLQQGKSPLRSVLFRSHVAAGPVAYWPLEEGTDAGQGGNAVSGGAPMLWTGTAPTRAAGGPPGSAPLWTVANDTDLSGTVPPYTPTTAGWWGFQFVFNLGGAATKAPTISLIPVVEILVSGSTIPRWRLTLDDSFGPDVLTLEGFDLSDTRVVYEILPVSGLFLDSDNTMYGHDIIFGMNIHQSGGNIAYDGAFASPESDIPNNLITFANSIAGTNGTVTSVRLPAGYTTARPGWVYGHISVWGKAFQLYDSQMNGYRGETVTARLARLCAEEGVSIDINGTSDTIMGPQGVDTFVNLLRECEVTDDGVLYDGRGPGLSYVARSVRYNATAALTASMAASPPQVGTPFRPVDDDQRYRNKVTVQRKNGASATFEDVTGPLGTDAIGTYDSTVSPQPNYNNDVGLLDRAAHEVAKGTVDTPYRYPTLNLDLAATPALIYDWLTADVSSRIDVTNIASKATQHPSADVSLLLEGWTETLTRFDWSVVGNCSPFDPWRAFVLDRDILDSDASTLNGAHSAGATSLSVATAANHPLWSHADGDFDLDVGGVKVTVTNITGAASPQTFTVTALPHAIASGAVVRLWRPPTLALAP